MAQSKTDCSCGRSYWPNQAWQHERCVQAAVEPQDATNSVPNAVVHNEMVVHKPQSAVVHKRSSDRHKNGDKRKAYKREWMRQRRARATSKA